MRRPHDFSKAYSLLVNREIGRRLLADPRLMRDLRREVVLIGEAHQRHARALWTGLVEGPVAALADLLARDDEAGDFARETRPAFIELDADTRERLLREARSLLEPA